MTHYLYLIQTLLLLYCEGHRIITLEKYYYISAAYIILCLMLHKITSC